METDYEVPKVPVETNGIDMYDEGVSRAFTDTKNYLYEEGIVSKVHANGSLSKKPLAWKSL